MFSNGVHVAMLERRRGHADDPAGQDEEVQCTDASAKALTGDERQAFMSTCLKADKKM